MHATICILLLHAGLAAAYSLTARPAILRQHRLAAMCASSDDEALRALEAKADARAQELRAEELLTRADAKAAELLQQDGASCSETLTPGLTAAPGVDPLTQRFQMKVKALQGEFSIADQESDTERHEGAITEGLLGFPCSLPIKVRGRAWIQAVFEYPT